jgi:hypothetical protein
MRCFYLNPGFEIDTTGLMEPKTKNTKVSEKVAAILQWVKNSKARALRLPSAYAARLDVMDAVSKNRTITTLDLSECKVCLTSMLHFRPTFSVDSCYVEMSCRSSPRPSPSS